MLRHTNQPFPPHTISKHTILCKFGAYWLISIKKSSYYYYFYSLRRKLFLERTHQIGKRSFAQLLMKLNWFDFIISIDLTNNVPALLSNSFGVSSWALILHWVFSSGNLMSKEATKLWVGIKTMVRQRYHLFLPHRRKWSWHDASDVEEEGKYEEKLWWLHGAV